jgi:hypothetical protein
MMGGCARRALVLVVLAGLGLGVWAYRERLRTAWHDIRGIRESGLVATPELAAAADAKLEALRAGATVRVALSAIELQSLLLYRYHGVLPAFLDSPEIELRDERVRLRARVPVYNLPFAHELGDALAILPDTTDLLVAVRLLPLDTGRVAIAVDEVNVQRLPLPRRLVPGALERLGRADEPGLPADAMALPLPPGVAGACVRRDSLVLLATRRTADCG